MGEKIKIPIIFIHYRYLSIKRYRQSQLSMRARWQRDSRYGTRELCNGVPFIQKQSANSSKCRARNDNGWRERGVTVYVDKTTIFYAWLFYKLTYISSQIGNNDPTSEIYKLDSRESCANYFSRYKLRYVRLYRVKRMPLPICYFVHTQHDLLEFVHNPLIQKKYLKFDTIQIGLD